MKAAIVPSANSKWEVKEINMPEPGENQVLIKIRASGNRCSGSRCHSAQGGRSRRGALGATYLRTLRMVCARQAHIL